MCILTLSHITHVLIYSCTRILMYSYTHVLIYLCAHIGNYELIHHREHIRRQYNVYASDFSAMLNDIRAAKLANRNFSVESLQKINATLLAGMYVCVCVCVCICWVCVYVCIHSLGIRFLSDWNSLIKEQCAFKYSRACSEAQYKAAGLYTLIHSYTHTLIHSYTHALVH